MLFLPARSFEKVVSDFGETGQGGGFHSGIPVSLHDFQLASHDLAAKMTEIVTKIEISNSKFHVLFWLKLILVFIATELRKEGYCFKRI